MRRVLVPLDGTPLAASILPDARRLAGPDGTLILIRDATVPTRVRGVGEADIFSLEEAEEFLNATADDLRADGARVETHALVLGDVAYAIDEAAVMYRADAIACATNGRSPMGRLVRGGVTWKTLAHSAVPVLVRNSAPGAAQPRDSSSRRILVPLDGSMLTESALPLARRLARDWAASVVLARVVPLVPGYAVAPFMYTAAAPDGAAEAREAGSYLDEVAAGMPGDVRRQVLTGVISSALIEAVTENGITDVVMASHGRTGLSRVVLGSVADDLIQHLHCPIVVVPALTAVRTTAPAREEGLEPLDARFFHMPIL